MFTPFKFPYLTQQQLRDSCPSKAHGKTWKQEQAYRDQCIDVIQKTCAALSIKRNTEQRAVILLHRHFTTNSSATCTKLDKWAVSVACLFLCQKLDSVYHRLESVVHSAIVELRKMQGRPMEAEYFNADGSPGNPAFLAGLAELVRRAEMEVLFSVNFAIDISVPFSLMGPYLKQLGLTEEAEMQYPDLADKISAVRREATHIAAACCEKGTAVVLQHPAEHLSLAAIFRSCKANKLQWYLRPAAEEGQGQGAGEVQQQLQQQQQRKMGEARVPDLTIPQLKAVSSCLPKIPTAGSSLRGPDPQANDGHGCFRSRGGRWLSKPPSKPALVKYEGGIRLCSNATDSSNGEAATGLPRLCDPSPSPDTANGPSSATAAAAAARNSSSGGGARSSSQQQRHVTFGELPPSVSLLQAQFRQRAAREERYRRQRSPEPSASLDSDFEDECHQQPQQQEGGVGEGEEVGDAASRQQQRQQREEERQALSRQLKRSREEAVGLAAGSDEEDSAVSRPQQQQQQQQRPGEQQVDQPQQQLVQQQQPGAQQADHQQQEQQQEQPGQQQEQGHGPSKRVRVAVC